MVEGDDIVFDKWTYKSGNYCQTEEECEELKQSLIVYNELKAYAEPDNAVWDGENHHWLIYYDYDYADIRVGRVFTIRYQTLSFSSGETAQAAIEAVGADKVKRHYLGIKED